MVIERRQRQRKRQWATSLARRCVGLRPVSVLLAALVLAMVGATAFAQSVRTDRNQSSGGAPLPGAPYFPTSSFDAFGNARPFAANRRRAGAFQSEAQRSAVRGFQSQGRRLNRRGANAPFEFGLGQLLSNPRRPVVTQNGPAVGSSVNPWQRAAFARYGGFGTRSKRGANGSIQDIFARRYALVAATSLNAPIHRAAHRSGLPSATALSVERTPFERSVDAPPVGSDVSLGDRLGAEAARAGTRALAEAWDWFHDAEYRRAVRSFNAVLAIDSQDSEARLGAMFCHLTLGAPRTAFAVMGEVIRREENPFLANVVLVSAYGNQVDARRLRVEAMRLTNPQTRADLVALRVLILWYLGERDEAKRLASIPLDAPMRVFASWGQKMNIAEEVIGVRPIVPATP